jgi:hypothetical protein
MVAFAPAARQTFHPVIQQAVHPVTQPAIVRTSVNVATVNPRLLNLPLGYNWGVSRGLPRKQFQLPVVISPVPAPTDQTLFEDPLKETSRFYLPAFAIATTSADGQRVNWVSLSPAGQGFSLTVHLADATSSAVATGNTKLPPPPTSYLLQANLNGLAKSWSFAVDPADGATLKLDIPDLTGRDAVYEAMTNPAAGGKLILQRTLSVAVRVPAAPSTTAPAVPNPGPLYRETSMAIGSSIPFTFDKDLNKNIFAQLQNIGSGLPAWNIVRHSWNGYPYPYYQDRSQPNQVYFLPDAFKIVRQPKPSYRPSMIVTTNGQDADHLNLTLSFLAMPLWDPQRITDAANQLPQLLQIDGPGAPLVLLPASSQNTALFLELPSSDPTTGQELASQPNALISISDGINAAVTLTLPQFQQVYNALFDNVSPLLKGQVNVTIPTNGTPDVESIPVTCRASDFAGDFFTINTMIESGAGSSGQIVVTLQNAIESPIQVESLTGVVMQGGKAMPGSTVEQIVPSPPVTLAPAQAQTEDGSPAKPADTLTVSVTLAPGTVVDSSAQVLFDFGQTQVEPDPKAIWQAIMQNQVVSPVSRSIQLKLLATVFTPASAAPTGSVAAGTAPTASPVPAILSAVQVVFENGKTANFDASLKSDDGGFLNQTVELFVPVGDYVLQQNVGNSYRYHVDQITETGTLTGPWVTRSEDVIYVSLS